MSERLVYILGAAIAIGCFGAGFYIIGVLFK